MIQELEALLSKHKLQVDPLDNMVSSNLALVAYHFKKEMSLEEY